MKRSFIALFLLVCLPLLYAQKYRYGQEPPTAKPGVDYPIKVHVSAVRIQFQYDPSSNELRTGPYGEELHANVVLDQEKLELTCGILYDPRRYSLNLVPGDYTARLLKTAHQGATTPFYDEYELLLPDRHVWRCTVTGMFE
ncbi:MAG: hypothetical protein ABSD59_12835 [Terracidiphilus sp.]|jgi:hypothetical protein